MFLTTKPMGGAGRLALKHPAEQLDLVWLFAARCQGALPRAAALKLMLDKLFVYLYAGRHAVYHTAHGLAMAFAE